MPGSFRPCDTLRMSTLADIDNTSRRCTKVVLEALPLIGAFASIVAVFTYTLEYIYVGSFFGHFGVAPEEVGLNEVELLTRAGIFAVTALAFFSAVLAIVGEAVRPVWRFWPRCHRQRQSQSRCPRRSGTV